MKSCLKDLLDRLFSQCRICDKLNEILSLSFRALCAHMHAVKTKFEGTVPRSTHHHITNISYYSAERVRPRYEIMGIAYDNHSLLGL